MLRFKNKVAIVSMLSMLGFGLAGCGNKDNQIADDDVFYYYDDKDESKDNETTINNSNISINTVETVTADRDVNIRTKPIDGEVLKVLYKGESLPLLEKLDNGWYAVSYNGGVAYICGKYLNITTEYEVNSSIKDIYYTNECVELKCFGTDKEEVISIDKNVCVEVYGEEGDLYLVSIDGHIGYMNKNNLTKLSNEFAVIDISSKTITLYKDNDAISVIPITNNISNSEKGIFYIYEIKTDRYLIGKDYQVYVDYIAYYGDNSYITYGEEENKDVIRKTLQVGSEVIVQQ